MGVQNGGSEKAMSWVVKKKKMSESSSGEDAAQASAQVEGTACLRGGKGSAAAGS